MFPLSLTEIAGVIGAEISGGGKPAVVKAVSTDSRKVKLNELFFALRGERFDGHNFIAAAVGAGAAGVVLEYDVPGLPDYFPRLKVRDTLRALQNLARHNRRVSGVPVVAVTGSSGKTSTKDLVASVLSQKYATLKTSGNFNNEIGLPLTLLKLNADHRMAVVEMAMRGPGEIDALCGVALPNAGVLTNIGEAHLERLGSVENIARAKGELLERIPPEGFAVLHGNSPHIREQAARCRGRVIFFGEGDGMDLSAREIRPEGGGNRFTAVTPAGERELFVPLPGRHSVINSLAAVAVGLACGLDFDSIARGLLTAELSAMRLETLEVRGIKVINDTYNANPLSTKAALQALGEVAAGGRKVAVLGDMLELGERAESGHREVGEAAARLDVEYLVAVGALAEFIALGARDGGIPEERVRHFRTNMEALKFLEKVLQSGDVVLVKGSRGMRMEEIVKGI